MTTRDQPEPLRAAPPPGDPPRDPRCGQHAPPHPSKTFPSSTFLAHLWTAERGIADGLRRLASGLPPWPAVDADKAIAWVEARQGVALADSQRAATRTALGAKLVVITGGPGVGKTTLVRSLLAILLAKRVKPVPGAPTGRAAKRLAESTGLGAKTLHRLLEFDPRQGAFRGGDELPLEGDVFVIDEASMVDVPLMASLVRAVPARAALVLVGDVDQLPSVGPGQVLRDVIDSGAVPVVRLTEVFRQAAQSRIVQSAHRINAGRLPELGRPEPDSPTSTSWTRPSPRSWPGAWSSWRSTGSRSASASILAWTCRSSVR